MWHLWILLSTLIMTLCLACNNFRGDDKPPLFSLFGNLTVNILSNIGNLEEEIRDNHEKIRIEDAQHDFGSVYTDGRVCISILHAPGDDPMGYESSAERWSPVQSVEKILLSVVSLLAEPNDESGANVDAAKMWREDREEFNKIAERLVRKTLGL